MRGRGRRGTWIRIAVWAEHRVATNRGPADRDLAAARVGLPRGCGVGRWNRRPRVAALVVASRGLWTPAERRTLAAHLRGLAARVHVISDCSGALGALRKRPGVLLLSGTAIDREVGRNARGRWRAPAASGPSSRRGLRILLGREWCAHPATRHLGPSFEPLTRAIPWRRSPSSRARVLSARFATRRPARAAHRERRPAGISRRRVRGGAGP